MTSRLRGITPLDTSFISKPRSRFTIGGCTNLISGWQTRNDGVASLNWLRTLRVGLGERWRVEGGVGSRMGRLWKEDADVVAVLADSLLALEVVS